MRKQVCERSFGWCLLQLLVTICKFGVHFSKRTETTHSSRSSRWAAFAFPKMPIESFDHSEAMISCSWFG